MKKALGLLAMIYLAGVMNACSNGIIADAKHKALIDDTAALSHETAVRAKAGELNPAEMVQAIVGYDGVLQEIKTASSSSPPTTQP